MKIPPTSSGIQGTNSTAAADTARAKAATSATPTSPAGSDSVKLSSLSTHLQSIQSGLSGPEFDRAKVDKIKQAISDGSLTINSGVVADRMLKSVQEFLANGTK